MSPAPPVKSVNVNINQVDALADYFKVFMETNNLTPMEFHCVVIVAMSQISFMQGFAMGESETIQ